MEDMMEIIPGILEHDKESLEEKIRLVAPYVKTIQLDIGDNTMFSCDTLRDMAVITPLIQKFVKTGIAFEAHLMVSDPISYLKPLSEAGCSRVIAHVECRDPREFLADARTYEMEVGLAIDTTSGIELIEPFLEEIDVVLVMTVEAGESGQEFESEAIDTIKAIHRNLPDLTIEVDGGMTPQTATLVKEAGATRLVSTSFIFHSEHTIPDAIAALQDAA